MASTMPVVAVESPTDEQIADGVAPTEYHGIPGLFFTFEAWRNVLIKVKLQQKDLEVALAHESTSRQIAEDEAAQLRKHETALQWRAQWGPPLAFAGGVTAAGLVALVIMGVMRSVAPIQGGSNGR